MGFSERMVVIFILSVVSSSLQVKVYKEDGDFIIGGLIPLHTPNESTGECGAKLDIRSLRLVEAIAFAVSEVNVNGRLKDLSLGYEIYDTCSSRTETLKSALNFLPSHRQGKDNILGVVGTGSSDSSLIATRLLGLYNISIVSYLSTSDELSNDKMYPYFFRTVAPDKFQISAVMDILNKYGWKYVVFMYAENAYGNNAKREFTNQAFRKDPTDSGKNDLCIAYSRGISLSATDDDYNDIITELLKKKQDSLVSVVVLFIGNEMAKRFFSRAYEKGIERDFIWIGSDSWGVYDLDPVEGVEESALGAFTIIPTSGTLANFDDFFYNQTKTSSNPWKKEFKDEVAACENNKGSCNGDDGRPQFESAIADAVEVLVRALEGMMVTHCGNDTQDCEDNIINNKHHLRDYILNVSFQSPSNGLINFTSSGDASGRFDIKNLQLKDGCGYRFINVGNWTQSYEGDDELRLDVNVWYLKGDNTSSRYNDQNIPKSVCTDPCKSKEVRINRDACCWLCDSCKNDDEIILNNECISCFMPEENSYKWPSSNLTVCNPLAQLKVFDEVENIIVIICAIVGILTEIAVVILFVMNFNAKLIRASSRELGVLILIGIFLCYVSAILYSFPSSIASCGLERVVPNIGLSLMYVSIATMTIRLHRIFQAGKRSVKRPTFISHKSQILVTLVLSAIPQLWSIIFMVIEPVEVDTVLPNSGRLFLERYCVDPKVHMVGHLVWDVAVIFVCCFFAVRTRNLPANYNQSRFIAFAVCSSIIVLIAFTPAYFTSDSPRTKDLYSSLGIIVEGTVILILIFMVKLYAVYFVPEERQQVISSAPSNQTTTDDNMPRITM